MLQRDGKAPENGGKCEYTRKMSGESDCDHRKPRPDEFNDTLGLRLHISLRTPHQEQSNTYPRDGYSKMGEFATITSNPNSRAFEDTVKNSPWSLLEIPQGLKFILEAVSILRRKRIFAGGERDE